MDTPEKATRAGHVTRLNCAQLLREVNIIYL